MPQALNKIEPGAADSEGECVVSPCRRVAPLPSRPVVFTNKAASYVNVKAPKAKQVTSGGKLAGMFEPVYESGGTHPIIAARMDCNPLAPHTVISSLFPLTSLSFSSLSFLPLHSLADAPGSE